MRWYARITKAPSLWAASIGTLSAFAFSTCLLQYALDNLFPEHIPPAEAQRLDLSQGWGYLPASAGRSPGDLMSAPDEPPSDDGPASMTSRALGAWQAFDPEKNGSDHRGISFSNLNIFKNKKTFSGRFWLKKNFEITSPPQKPAIVLGSIPGFYRVYLNGRMIGQVNQNEELAYLVFDPSNFNLQGENTLLVNAKVSGSRYPGFAMIPDVGAFIGEFDDIRRTVSNHAPHRGVMEAVFCSLCAGVSGTLLVFSLSAAFAALSDRRSRARISEMPGNPVLSESNPIDRQIREAHEKTAQIIKALRSTLYCAAPSSTGQPWFEAISIVGDPNYVRRSRPIFEDLIGTSCKSGSPWLIHDIGEILKLGSRSQYSSRSCIIIPLCDDSGNVLGALTLTDKEGGVAFTQQDFTLSLEAASELTSLFRERLEKARAS